jgi:hypothetical protein
VLGFCAGPCSMGDGALHLRPKDVNQLCSGFWGSLGVFQQTYTFCYSAWGTVPAGFCLPGGGNHPLVVSLHAVTVTVSASKLFSCC